MKSLSANIEVVSSSQKEKTDLLKLFESEDSLLSNNRASYKIIQSDEKIIFKFTADDAVALRAIINAVCKTLSVFEKMQNVK